MLIVARKGKLTFPTYLNNEFDQGTKAPTARAFRNFYWISLVPTGVMPVIHYSFKGFRANVINDHYSQLGVYIDVMGAVTKLEVKPKLVPRGETEAADTQVLSLPKYIPVDIPLHEDDEFVVLSSNQRAQEMCTALLEYGLEPDRAISRTFALLGKPGGHWTSEITIKEVVADINKNYSGDADTGCMKGNENFSENLIHDLIKEGILNGASDDTTGEVASSG